MKYNEKIVALRKANGFTQEGFAKAVGVTRQAVYKWEVGDSYPEAEKLIAIKALFGISIDDLLDDTFDVIIEKPKREPRRKTSPIIPAQVKKEEAPVAEVAPAVEETPVVEEKPQEKEAPAEVPAEEKAPAVAAFAAGNEEEDDEFEFVATVNKKEAEGKDLFDLFRHG